MIWEISHRADPFARDIADRHYNRQKIGTPQFVPPGRCLVLRTQTETGRAFWVTGYPFAEFVKHAWPGAWICSAFRNEGAGVASEMIKGAVSASRWMWPEVPALGMITFLDRRKVRPIRRRGKVKWGRTWELAGFKRVGKTKGGLIAYQLLEVEHAAPASPGRNCAEPVRLAENHMRNGHADLYQAGHGDRDNQRGNQHERAGQRAGRREVIAHRPSPLQGGRRARR